MQSLDEMAPEIQLRNPDGTPLLLSSLRGRPLLIHFWATWCKPCRHELPAIDALANRFEGSDLVFLLISIDSDAPYSQISERSRELAPHLPLYLASDGKVDDRYWTWGIPVTYLLDRNGRMIARALGPHDWNSSGMQALLHRLADADPLQPEESVTDAGQ